MIQRYAVNGGVYPADSGLFVYHTDHLAALAEERARIVSGQFMQICGYCGEEMQPPSQWEKLQEHIQKCPRHPLTEAKEQIADLLKKLERSNDAWISGQEQIASYEAMKEGVQVRIGDLEEQIASLTESCNYWRRLWRLTEAAERKAGEEITRLREALDTIESMATDTTHDIQGIAQAAIKEGGKP